jgi:DNA-binding CsgD family transcriptional regulator
VKNLPIANAEFLKQGISLRYLNMFSSKNDGHSSKNRMNELVLTELQLPLLVVDAPSGVVMEANQFAHRTFSIEAGSFDCWQPRPLSDVIPFHAEIHTLVKGMQQGDSRLPYGVCLVQHDGNAFQAIASRVDDAGEIVCVLFFPQPTGAAEINRFLNNFDVPPAGIDSAQMAAMDALNRQLHFERLVRQIMSKVYSSLDKDAILQALVDNLGRALKVQRCLVIVESAQALPVVTHEYAEADISPLGLGRTAKFPASVFERLLEGVVAVPDVTNLRTVKGVMLEDVNDLLDNSVSSMAGVPMVHRGVAHGVIVALELGHIRKWEVQDLDFLQICAHHAAISLEHCQSLQRIKDQLFNVNVWSSLTQQLTSTLELASRSSSRPPDKPSRNEAGGEMPALSSRELEVLKLIASGLANKEIANQLFLTESTVELHASRIRKKLKLRSRTALVKYACDHDIV